jgi:hypothetical protein
MAQREREVGTGALLIGNGRRWGGEGQGWDGLDEWTTVNLWGGRRFRNLPLAV